MKSRIISLFVSSALLAVSVFGQTTDVEELAKRNADFATRLYSKIASSNDDNVVVSTLGATLALATLATGANGATRTELLQGILVDSMEKEPERIQTLLQQLRQTTAQIQATGLFIKMDVKANAGFDEQVKQSYDADVQNLNFANAPQAEGSIENYVRTKTGDKVKDVVKNLDPQIKAMLISATFFTGHWLQPFNVTFTQQDRFYVNKYNIVQVPMMLNSGKYYLAYDSTLKVGILKLPCEEGIAMLVLLPDGDVDYTYVDESMTGEVFHEWVAKLKKTKLEIQLPRFSLKQSNSLSASLPSLGIKEIFGETADLSGISSDEGLKLSEVLQKVVVEVDETGGSFADASSNLFTNPLPPRLTFNRPFSFIVYHEATKCILHIGRVVDPTKN